MMKKMGVLFAGLLGIALSSAQAGEGWSGPYIGAQVGVSEGKTDIGDLDDYWDNQEVNGLTDQGSVTGLYTGWSLQKGSLVYGLEAAYNTFGVKTKSTAGNIGTVPPEIMETDVKSAMSVKVRAGMAVENTLVYVAAGPVQAKIDFRNDDPPGALFKKSKTFSGYVFAWGVETMLMKHLTARLQAERMQLDNENYFDPLKNSRFRNTTSVFNISLGVAYKF